MGGFNDAGNSLRFISEHKIEWGSAGGGMKVVVVDKLSHRDVFSPCFRVGAAKDTKVGLDSLVEPFHFSVGLWVIRCG